MSLIKLGFIAPRKKLIANLAIGLHKSRDEIKAIFTKLNLNENARPADLTIENWCAIEKELKA
jgi:16S rRNA A1518/A1519 N6-dimethyltransferase RsmA/KsgA/DIM1 with predicted DNA glycosylase/AP lyase activity